RNRQAQSGLHQHGRLQHPARTAARLSPCAPAHQTAVAGGDLGRAGGGAARRRSGHRLRAAATARTDAALRGRLSRAAYRRAAGDASLADETFAHCARRRGFRAFPAQGWQPALRSDDGLLSARRVHAAHRAGGHSDADHRQPRRCGHGRRAGARLTQAPQAHGSNLSPVAGAQSADGNRPGVARQRRLARDRGGVIYPSGSGQPPAQRVCRGPFPMLVHPQFDPIAFSIGPLSVRWYGLMYLVGFFGAYLLGRWRIARGRTGAITQQVLDDLLFFAVLGGVLGGRLGYVLFYKPGHYLAHPAEIMADCQGGMSFHGGFLGVLIAVWWVARKYRLRWLDLTDFLAPLVPVGLATGRLGNFINGELWGRAASPDLPWAMVFPMADATPRHPSQLYQFGLEGVALFVLLWWYSSRPRPTGAVSGMFLIGYGVFRFIA